ncbi:MAG TPA: class I SAM-dependent methyltransferase [Solirubrobacteraceae bacterium]|nr:class I SAM-dependent methyltransferase [Solirubrobacteraceae bacterium]
MSVRAPSRHVIWHDLECGAYTADLPVWRELAEKHSDPILDVGAGTGRVTLDLARRGHSVIALDQDPVLLAELERRAAGLAVQIVQSDARSFALEQRFALVIVPMQTVQLLGGASGRERLLQAAGRHLEPGGVLALAITEELEHFAAEDAAPLPLPDMRELDGVVYSSQPTAVREAPGGFVLERLRERIGPTGERSVEPDVIHLDRLSSSQLQSEARTVGFDPLGTRVVPETPDHVGSVVVMLGG